MTDAFVAPLPGSWIMAGPDALRLVSHEAVHAVVAIVRGLCVTAVRIDNPDVDTRGCVQVVPDLDRLYDHLLSVIAGPVAGGRQLQWKPNRDEAGDEGAAALLADKLHLDGVSWLLAHHTVRTTLRQSKGALSALGGALLGTRCSPRSRGASHRRHRARPQHHEGAGMTTEPTPHQRIVEAFSEGADDEALRRARVDALFSPSSVHEEMVAAIERDPSVAGRVLNTHNRIALENYLTAKRRAAAARQRIDRHERRKVTT